MISQYRALFAVPGFARLLVSSILGRLPSGMFSLAVLLLVRQQTGSFLDAGLAVGVFTLTGAALSPLQGTLVDRLGQTRVLLPCAIAQAILLVVFMDVVRAGASLGVTLGSAEEVTRHRFSFSGLVAESNTRPYTNSGDPWTFVGDTPELV